MKKIYYIVFAILVSGLLDACIHDDTSLADPDFSRLSIISQYDTLRSLFTKWMLCKAGRIDR